MTKLGIGLRGALLAGASVLAWAPAADAQQKFQCPRKGGDFVFAQEAKANSLDQHTSSTISTRNVAMNMFESLMTRDDNMKPIPELAETVTESPDKKTYTFKLRQGIKFHNGKAMTSADVMASYDRYMKVGIDKGIYAIVDKFEAPDAFTFVARLKEPQPTFLENFSSFSVPVVIVPSEITNAPPMQMQTIGTGPFQLTEFVADSHAKMKRYDGYVPNPAYNDIAGFGGYKLACLDTVNVRFIVEPGARVAGLETGEFHAVEDLPAKSLDRLKANPNIALKPLNNFWVQIAIPNFSAPPTDNLKVRQAIQAALDMEEIMEAATDGAFRLNIGFQYPGQEYYSERGKETYNQKDAAKAKRLLAEGGYKGEKLVLLTNRDYTNMYVAATVMAEQLKAIGMNVELRVLDWPASVQTSQNTTEGWNFFFTGWGTNTSLGGIATIRFSAPPFNTHKPKEPDPNFVAAFNRIANGETLEARKAAFADSQAIMLETVMALPFGSLTKVQASRANVNDFRPFRIPRFSNVSITKGGGGGRGGQPAGAARFRGPAMGRYIVRRLVQAVPILALVSLISFGIMQLVPGDAAILIGGPSATPAELDQIRKNLGLDQPFHVQLFIFYVNLLQGDLGRSLLLGKPVLEATIERIPVTATIALYSMALTLLFGIALGVVAALRQNSWVDQVMSVIALLGISLPSFWFGLMMIVLFSVHLGWFPTSGYVDLMRDPVGWLRSATMPAVSLALLQIGLLARITRSTVIEVLRQDYIRTARAKGLSEWTVVGKHVMANVAIPVVTVIGLIFSVLLSGSVVIETVFTVPGIGSLLGNAILRRDYPMIQGGLIFVAVVLMLLNIVVDVLYAYFDPRVRYDVNG